MIAAAMTIATATGINIAIKVKMMENKRKKVFIILPLKKKEKKEYGTFETTFANIPVLADVTAKSFIYEKDGSISLEYTILPYMEQAKNGKLLLLDEENSAGIKELKRASIYLYDNLEQCVESCKKSNEYVLQIDERSFNMNLNKEETNKKLRWLKNRQQELIDEARMFLNTNFPNMDQMEKGV